MLVIIDYYVLLTNICSKWETKFIYFYKHSHDITSYYACKL